MIVGRERSESNFGLTSTLVEPITNHDASSFIISDYTKLLGIIRGLGIKEEKAHDLLHDVYISVTEAESEGNGYDAEYNLKCGNANEIGVEQFVVGRIKLYAKNSKYSTDVIETGTTSCIVTETIEVPVMTKKGYLYDDKGNIVMEKQQVKEKRKISTSLSAASYNQGADGVENNDSFQTAYAMATSADNIEEVDDFHSLREQIDYCIDICALNNVNILNVFRNMDELASMLGDHSRKKKSADNIFEKLTKLVEYHSELATALTNVLTYSATNRANFESVLATY